jgi:cell division septation protein DedD
LIAAGCKKEEAPAVIEEAPAAAAPVETDTSATLMEEPNLQAVGQGSGSPAGSPLSAEAAGFSDRGSFVVQVNVFKSPRQAAALVEKLAAQGYPAYVAQVEDPTPDMPGTYHRVRIGRFRRIADAKAFGENTLRPAGYDFWVDNKKNDQVGASAYGSDSYSSPASSPSSYSAPVEDYSSPSAPSEPAAPASDPWGAPSETPAAANSEPAEPAEPAAPAAAASEPAAPSADSWGAPSGDALPGTTDDTAKVNLDEW